MAAMNPWDIRKWFQNYSHAWAYLVNQAEPLLAPIPAQCRVSDRNGANCLAKTFFAMLPATGMRR